MLTPPGHNLAHGRDWPDLPSWPKLADPGQASLFTWQALLAAGLET